MKLCKLIVEIKCILKTQDWIAGYKPKNEQVDLSKKGKIRLFCILSQ